MSQIVCQKDDLQPGEIMEVTYKKKSIVLCRSKAGEFYAFLNRCLHQGAPLSEGKLCSTSAFTDTHGEYKTVKDGEILRCPWHGIEFDITDGGRVLADPRLKLRDFNVHVEGNDVILK